uniref:Uncharacterized protein n=1 Tax=Lactuca sativa TaxID=4236 RepID=A0A9R1VCE2_LACSA|nr:hypothetical protein LSAT_V11C600324620 [Lactuca sativa]
MSLIVGLPRHNKKDDFRQAARHSIHQTPSKLLSLILLLSVKLSTVTDKEALQGSGFALRSLNMVRHFIIKEESKHSVLTTRFHVVRLFLSSHLNMSMSLMRRKYACTMHSVCYLGL